MIGSEQNKHAHARLELTRALKEGCSRCRGLLVPTTLYDIVMERGALLEDEYKAEAYKCASCGDVVDEVILKHRADNVLDQKIINEYWNNLNRGEV